ncbi:MAG TPA: class I tRNA ligase family protein [Flavobacteriales bacterium]|nr:class I tRNA ligase family protein [Flavobacteriales bacterium]
MEYNHRDIEKKWQAYWAKEKTFKAENDSSKPKYYVLDMFPYPSGAGLHVGHPLGYIASDIVTRYKRLKGFNVLHPMGYDSFGLPAEQYAIQTGQHPKITTEQNIKRYREQLDKIGFSFDWDREVQTSDPNYYKWTQWIFLQLFNSWYNPRTNKAEKLETLIAVFEKEGFKGNEHDILTGDIEKDLAPFTAVEWKSFDLKKQNDVLMNFRLAYLGEAYVNWCPAMGTVLANDEVKDGVSERGGHPVERKLMKQWSMRITAYAQRLLDGLDTIDWSDSLKEAQRNWIGRSQGCSIKFRISNFEGDIEVFTTRPDTLFGVSYLTLAPEHELVDKIVSAEQKDNVTAYVTYAKNRSERERMADVKKVTGEFTGAYAIHPFTNEKIPVWIGDYVLAGYGTGAVMAVPAHDERDHAFARHFGLQLKQVIELPEGWDLQKASYDEKKGKVINSDFMNGMEVVDAIKECIQRIENHKFGKGQINYRLRDAVFGRQRYWGEPIPIYYKDGIPHGIPENELPLTLPEVDKYLPTPDGEPPLARANNWKYKGQYEYELTTMPGWAGSSWYFLRYMDPHNTKAFADKAAMDYWGNVDLYIGGSEHATGHLLYVRFWTKFLKDFGLINVDEPAQKLINQGMIGGMSEKFYLQNIYQQDDKPHLEIRFDSEGKFELIELPKSIQHIYVSADVREKGFVKGSMDTLHPRNLPIELVDNSTLIDRKKFVEWHLQDSEAVFVCLGGYWYKDNFFPFKNSKETSQDFRTVRENEKMSKSKYNVVNPDQLCEKFGADSFRLYEMFLGPLTDSKPWDTKGIEGVSRFLKKLWRLYAHEGKLVLNDEEPSKPEYKALHKCIKRVTEDIDRYSFNTVVSTFMICVNELSDLKCNKRKILEPLAILLSPYAPHIAEELWSEAILGHKHSVTYATWPELNESYLVEDSFAFPISFNGKTKFNLEMSLTLTPAEIEKLVMEHADTQRFLEGKPVKKVIVVPKKIVNIVV